MTSHDGLAPIKRATVFFGIMAAVVGTLTFGAGIQGAADQSSATVAEAKLRQNIPADSEFAAAQRDEKIAMPVRRAVSASQEARLAAPGGNVVR